MPEEKMIHVSNQIRCCVCNDRIWSAHRHDYRTCECGAVAVDGGMEYLRRTGHQDQYEELSISMPEKSLHALAKALTLRGVYVIHKVFFPCDYQYPEMSEVCELVQDTAVQSVKDGANTMGALCAAMRALRDHGHGASDQR